MSGEQQPPGYGAPGSGPHGGYQFGSGAPTPPGAPGAPSQPPYPPYPQYPPYQRARGTNGLAIASLVCSIAAFAVCVSAPVGLVLGLVALSQIKRTGEDGRGLAIAGVWIGGIVTALMVAGLVLLAGVVAFAPGSLDDGGCTDSYGSSISCD